MITPQSDSDPRHWALLSVLGKRWRRYGYHPSMPAISTGPAWIMCFIRCSIDVLQEIQQILSDQTTNAEFQLCNIGR